MTDLVIIENKLSDLQSYYAELADILKEDSRSIIDDNLKLRSVERLFQLIVDTAIDINTHIIVTSHFPVPDDYQSTFITLAQKDFLSMDFAHTIAPSVGLRNLVVHRYGNVDVKRMVDDIRKEIGQYREYAAHIAAAIQARN